MIVQPARVVAETDVSYLLETLPKLACPRCEAGQGCGGGILAQAFANKTYQLSINKNTSLKINELVQIGIKSSLLVRASMLVYLVPLIFMIAFVVLVGSFTNYQDLYTVAGAAAGMLVGTFVAKKLSNLAIHDSISSPVLIDDDKDSCWYHAQ
ncbi:MAG: SoxR reducing system RseC family protein [Gammaproteobacteria bacterium]|nr:SoxR reducing system RseC family protein [Gammaproteobacteria bacterium]